ncbi:MAG: DNA topoisomerase IV subunit A [Phycisphaeraceae bacterium]|nr:DNA topoisomerase IV subunit A [Phycisphaeraceae bacterium]MCW5762097.1 DNA topoisomerase IV subunit A [Phycisphaeraceae bacterium]
MAKKAPGKKVSPKPDARIASPARQSSASAKKRDQVTAKSLQTLADGVVKASLTGVEPSLAVPTRAKSNTKWDKKRGILRMGDARSERQLFNLGMARSFMQTLLHGQSIQSLIEADKTLSLRGMFYRSLHTIQGTKEKTFDDQTESDGILEDLEVTLGALREELHIFAKKRGTMVGNITVIDSGDEINCRKMGTGGYAIPSICEPDVIQFKNVNAKFVLHVEKDTVWQRFNEDRFWETHNCILTEGSGQPPRGVRRLLHRLNKEHGLPIICLLDCDPWGHYIYSVIKQGSISLAFESERLAIPEAKFLGIRAKDYEACELSDDVQIALNDRDTQRARQIMEYPWFADHKGWQREIQKMLDNGFKMEVESLITKDISYVTEVYVPQRLKAQDWLS